MSDDLKTLLHNAKAQRDQRQEANARARLDALDEQRRLIRKLASEETYLELKAGWLSQLKDELKGIAEGTREYLSSESYYDYESWKVPHYLRFAHEAGLVVTRNDRKETRDICENLCMETTIWVEIP